MKRNTKIALGVGAALSLGLAAAMVNAQGYGPGTGYGPGMGSGPAYMMGGVGPGRMMGYGYHFGNPAAAMEGRLAEMQAELKITAAQESAWQAYAARAKAQAESMQAWHAAIQAGTQATAPERLAQRDAMMKQRLAQHEAMTAAFKDLYAALSPEQRSIADQGYLAMGPGPRGPGGPGGRFR